MKINEQPKRKVQKRILELADRSWKVEDIRERLKHLRKNGFGATELNWAAIQNNRDEVLNRVQLRAEEYEYLTHSCAKGSASVSPRNPFTVIFATCRLR